MFCEKYAEWGILYLYDELEFDAKQAFEAHLNSCPQCQGVLALLKESKLFAQMLPLEEIAPISYEEIVPSLKPDHSFFEKYIQPYFNSICSLFQNKRHLILIPVGVAFLFLIMIYVFNPGFKIFKSSVSLYSETIFDWDIGLEESLNDLDQKITQLKSENRFMEKDSLDNSLFYSSVDYFCVQHIDQIEADIQSLSSELTPFNF